ncbi:MAG: FecR domain-containing protein [Rhodospirillaceae bacterium]|nr:FecR domain-containing protein [Rhodospirillaceae bacterium]
MRESTLSPSFSDAEITAAMAWRERMEAKKPDAKEPSEAEWIAFTEWLEVNPRHRLAYDIVDFTCAETEQHATALESALHDSDALPPQRAPWWALPSLQSRRFAAVMGIVVIGVAAAALNWTTGLGPAANTPAAAMVQTTNIGERRDVQLTDKTSVVLNSGTRIAVAYDQAFRKVTLENGEAFFDVVPDASRPFVVDLGHAQVRVVGTAFNILRHKNSVTVTVTRGAVKVLPTAGKSADAGFGEDLAPGDQLIYADGQATPVRRKVDVANVTAWREGRLVFESAALSQVVEDLNRYYPEKAINCDGSACGISFTGVLKLDGQEAVLRRLQEFVPVVVVAQSDGVILRSKPLN